MLKMFPVLLIFLPVLLVLVGVLFRAANPVGVLLAVLIHLALCGGVVWWANTTESLASLILSFVLLCMSFWIVPWLGAVLSFAVPPSPGPVPVEEIKKAYQGLSPQQQEALKRTGKAAFRAGARHYADILRQKGKPKLADGLDEIVR